MTIFYDPQKRQPHIWVIAAFAIVPIVVVIIMWIHGQGKAKNKPMETGGVDIFAK